MRAGDTMAASSREVFFVVFIALIVSHAIASAQ